MKDIIKRLAEAHGPSGFEDQVRALIQTEIRGLADSTRVTALGSLIAVKQGSGSRNARRVMLAAHMDEIGLMVTHVDAQGFARVTNIGTVFVQYALGARVRFADGSIGVVNADRQDDAGKLPKLEDVYIDTGALDRASAGVKVGDAASFSRPFADLGDCLVAKSMDNRIGCAILIEVMRRLKRTPHEVQFVFAVQEETTHAGARTAAYQLNPDLALVVDVTPTGDTPKALSMAVELGKGPAVKVQDSGMTAHTGVKNLMIRRAEENGLAYQLEVLRGGTTDAAEIQLAREGVPSGALSVPCRHVHSPSEMVSTADVLGSVDLLLAILRRPIEV